jgi:hypothetical protein
MTLEWLPVSDAEAERIAPERLLSVADILLGGHASRHRILPSNSTKTMSLKPVRVPAVIRSVGATPNAASSERRVDWRGFARLGSPAEWGMGGSVLRLAPPGQDPLSRAYLTAVSAEAPDEAAGYARWVKLAETARHATAKIRNCESMLALVDASSSDENDRSLWRGGAGTARAVGLPEGGTIVWPEAISSPIVSKRPQAADSFRAFCEETGKCAAPATSSEAAFLAPVFRTLMAGVLLDECLDSLRNAWKAIRAGTGEAARDAEAYLTERPPWPPASILRLRKERGFEYVGALAEQVAIDRDQRDWLVRAFQEAEGKVDFQRLETSDDGRLSESLRFRTWIHAEWAAWVRQRARRTERYLSNPLAGRTSPTSKPPEFGTRGPRLT